MHVDSKARPSRIAAEPGRDKRVPSRNVAETGRDKRAPSRNAAEPGRDKRVPPGTLRRPDAASASLPERRSAAKSRPFREGRACPVRNRPHGISTGMDLCGVFCTCHAAWRTLRQDPEETKGRGLRRAPCLAFSGITRNAVAYLVSAAFMNLAVSAVTVMTALPSANVRFEAS